jgi:hypothetical protein
MILNSSSKTSLVSRVFALNILAVLALSLLLVACGHQYEFKAIPVRPLNAYPGQASLDNVSIGAQAFFTSSELKNLFGFNLREAGVIPVQVLIRNSGNTPIVIEEGSTVQDEAGYIWQTLPSNIVYDRINDYTSGSLSGSKGAKRTLLWGIAGGIVGAAAGIATGDNVAEAAGKGAAVGAAAGAASSVLGVGTTEDSSAEIQRDFSGRSLDHATIEPGVEASGFLYFPAESAKPRSLALKVSRGNKTDTLNLNL